MGWWESGRLPGVMLGDDAFDAAYAFLGDLAGLYDAEFGRRPTLDELRALLEIELRVSAGQLLTDFDEHRVVEVVIKTASKRRDQPVAVGDVFAIPLGDGDVAFGRVMNIDRARGTLIEVFRRIAKTFEYTPSIVESGRMFHPVLAITAPLRGWRWTVVSGGHGYELSSADQALVFASPGPGRSGWSVVDLGGKIVRAIDEAEGATMERGWVWQPEQVEQRIRENIPGS